MAPTSSRCVGHRRQGRTQTQQDWFSRGKRTIIVDIRTAGGADVVARLADVSDVLIESNRPGRLEARGLGPDDLLRRNPRLVYTRLTGWGQDGAWASRVGHDINYIAGAGLLGTIASPDSDQPVPPMNLLGDFASGSLMAVLGTVLALFERERTGLGQVVDAAMVDGAALLARRATARVQHRCVEGSRAIEPERRRAVLRHVPMPRRRVVRRRCDRATLLPSVSRHHRTR